MAEFNKCQTELQRVDSLVYDLNIKEPDEQKLLGARFLDDSNNRK